MARAYNAATHPVMEQEAPNLALYLLCNSCHPSWMRLLKEESILTNGESNLWQFCF